MPAAVALAVALAVAGCSRPGTVPADLAKTAPAPTDTLPAGTCPQPDDLPSAIDWADFVQVRGRMYVRDAATATVTAAEVGEPLGTVRCTFSLQSTNPWLVARDGDASFLRSGTELRAVTGRPVSEVVAAAAGDGRWWLYRVSNE